MLTGNRPMTSMQETKLELVLSFSCSGCEDWGKLVPMWRFCVGRRGDVVIKSEFFFFFYLDQTLPVKGGKKRGIP